MTEMDFTTLAIVARDGPMSAYDVRKVFAQSLTPSWSSSTGSVYPSIARLEKAGLIFEAGPAGTRGRKELRLTPPGRKAVAEWLKGLSAEVAAPTPDPVRTRFYFLSLLSEGEQAGLIEAAMRGTREAISAAEQLRAKRLAGGGDEVQRYAAEGVLYELRARLEWLGWMAGQLGRSRGGTAPGS